jgi:predicted alpha/beta-hydrolase family hydrolase
MSHPVDAPHDDRKGPFDHGTIPEMKTVSPQKLGIEVGNAGAVSALLIRPTQARACFVFAHGAGAGMTHPFMETAAHGLGERGVATLRYQFPYMEKGTRRPDPPAIAQAAVRSAVAEAGRCCPGLRLIAGGKSFGGRMTSQAQAVAPLDGVDGLAFLGFPLHPAGKPSSDRAKHLSDVHVPMLFLQGTRDNLAELRLLEPVVKSLGPSATLHPVQEADHSFHVLARSGRNDREALSEVLDTLAGWIGAIAAS